MKKIKNKTELMLRVESSSTLSLEELLRVKFVDENKPLHQIRIELGINYQTLLKWLRLAGIYSRKLNIRGDETCE